MLVFLFYVQYVEREETICRMSQTEQACTSTLMLLLSVIKIPTQTPIWTVTTRCSESIRHLHYRWRYTFHYRYVVCAVMFDLFKCQFSWFVSWSRFLFPQITLKQTSLSVKVKIDTNKFLLKMNKWIYLFWSSIPIPLTPNILSLSSAGEKFNLLMLIMLLKNIDRSVQKFENCSFWFWIHL